MKKTITIIIITLICGHTTAQIPAIFGNNFPDSSKTRVGTIGDYNINSTALTAEFVYSLHRGGYIDSDEKNNVSKRLKNMNTFGGDLNYGLYTAFKTDSIFHKKNISLFFSLRSREHIDCQFPKDLFNVAFYGNASYAGKNANFSDFTINHLSYQQFQFGFFTTNFHSEARWGIALSIINGSQYTLISAPRALLYTSPDGQYITLNSELDIVQSDTTKDYPYAINGFGGSIDVYFEAPYKTRFGNSKIIASVGDIGGIKFNKNSLFLNQDSVFQFEGIKVNGIYEMQNSLYESTTDSIVSSTFPFSKQVATARLPSILNLSNETQLNPNFKLTEGVRFVYNANYTAFGYVKGDFNINPQFSFSGLVGYGGYGKLSVGLGMQLNLKNDFFIYASSENIIGFIAPKKSCGQALFVSLAKNFK